MLVMGTLVTDTGSGQGCGNSWPFCHGQIIPGVITVAGIIEYSHRVQASMVGTLVLVLTIWTWLVYKKDFRVKLLGFLSILFVVIQGVLGALTVVFEGTFEKDKLLSIHFGLSLLALAFVILLTIRLFQIGKEARDGLPTGSTGYMRIPKLQVLVWGLALYTYIIVYTGALVKHSGAILGCGYQIPGCGSTYFPDFTSLAGIQMLHRYAAASIWLLMLGFLVLMIRNYRDRRDMVSGAWWAFILITLQAISGMAIVLTGGQLLTEITHVTLIATFFTILSYLCMQVGWFRERQSGEGALKPTSEDTSQANGALIS
jgi:cytochrome c oxidase assembly protein subunit 15